MTDPIPTIAALNALKLSAIRIVSSTSEYGFLHYAADRSSGNRMTEEADEEIQLTEDGRKALTSSSETRYEELVTADGRNPNLQ